GIRRSAPPPYMTPPSGSRSFLLEMPPCVLMEILVTTGGGSRKSFLSLVSSHRQIWDYYTTYKQGILQEVLPSWISPFYKQTLILYTIQKVDAEFKTLGEGSVSVNLDTTIRDMDPAFVPRWEKLARKTLNS